MPKKPYSWKHGNVPLIGDHSIAKHRILREYVDAYVEVLTRNPRIERLRLTIVDGFAGGCIYRRHDSHDPHLGSPAILIESTSTARERVNSSRRKPVHLESNFVFVEKDPEVAAVLGQTLEHHVLHRHAGTKPVLLIGAFEEQLDAIIQQIKSIGRAHRAIFVLDQYGYTAVPLPLLQKIFQNLPNAEVFLTVATGWISAYLQNTSDATQVLRDRMGVRFGATDDEIDAKLVVGDGDSRIRLRVVQRLLHDAFKLQAGAKYFTPFFIFSRESNRPYWFLHLACSHR